MRRATGAIVPVAVGLLEGEAVGIYGMVGIAAAILGVKEDEAGIAEIATRSRGRRSSIYNEGM